MRAKNTITLETLERMYWKLYDSAERRNGLEIEKTVYYRVYTRIYTQVKNAQMFAQHAKNTSKKKQAYGNAIYMLNESRKGEIDPYGKEMYTIAITLLREARDKDV